MFEALLLRTVDWLRLVLLALSTFSCSVYHEQRNAVLQAKKPSEEQAEGEEEEEAEMEEAMAAMAALCSLHD